MARRILAAVEDRRSALGPRVAARDIENALEDTVSVFEAVLKSIARRHLVDAGRTSEEVEKLLDKTIRSQFQNPDLASRLWLEHLGLSLFDAVPAEVVAEQGALRIELKGNLAAMLSAATNAKRSPESGDLSLQVQMVAGACNRRYLQLWSGAA